MSAVISFTPEYGRPTAPNHWLMTSASPDETSICGYNLNSNNEDRIHPQTLHDSGSGEANGG